jgi:multicomponent Na+:H+ antiporter subunit B
MNAIVKTVARVMFPLIILFGIYVVVHGHTTPGGTFSGGSVMAGAFVIYTLAYGLEDTRKQFSETPINVLKSVGGLVLILLIIFEFFLREALVPTETIFTVWSASSLMFFNIVGGIMVFTGLLMIWYTIVRTDSE